MMDEFIDESIEKTINNKYDYSNAIVGNEQFMYIVNYFENIMKNFSDILDKEEEKNSTLKYDYKHYDYKRTFSTGFKINLRNDKVGYKDYSDINVFKEDFNNKLLTNLENVSLVLDLTFQRGIGTNLPYYTNKFKVEFRPYEIVFSRESDHNVMIMNQIENNIKSMLDQLPVVNTIFCSKGE
jgi:hypothetical protein